jgi:pyruvate/2-oxoacid:ferredoxin oxidoreductase beta subunit
MCGGDSEVRACWRLCSATLPADAVDNADAFADVAHGAHGAHGADVAVGTGVAGAASLEDG